MKNVIESIRALNGERRGEGALSGQKYNERGMINEFYPQIPRFGTSNYIAAALLLILLLNPSVLPA